MNLKITAKEYSLNCHGLNFLCVLGQNINGGYCAILNWGVSAELSRYRNDLDYNRRKIREALERSSDSVWLPSGEDGRDVLARDLAMMIGDRIHELPL